MKKLLLIISLIMSVASYGQLAIKKSQDTINQNLRVSKNIIDSIYKQEHFLTYTLSCVSTNTGSCYSNGNTIGNNTLTPASNFTMSIPNGIYEIVSCYFVWGNSNNHVNNFLLTVWSNTITGAGDDNTTPAIFVNEKINKFQTSIRFGEYLDANGHPLLQGYDTYFSGSPVYSGYRNAVTVSNNLLNFVLISKSGDCPGASTDYRFVFKLKKLR